LIYKGFLPDDRNQTSLNLLTAEKQGAGFSMDTVRDMAVSNLERRIGMAKKHDAVTYNSASEDLEDAANRMDAALQKLLASEKATTEKAKAAISRAKDSAAQVGDALARVKKLLGADFENKIAQLERMATSLEKLAELEKTGKLSAVISAMKG
jgi:exonuclease VII large subunit